MREREPIIAEKTEAGEPPEITVVLPVHNGRAAIERRYAEVAAALAGRRFEAIVVDDGSVDGSAEELRRLAGQDARLRVVRLRRSFGRTAALTAGFDRARGATIVTIDLEGGADAADIPRVLEPIAQGFDVASGWRDHRSPAAILGSALISAITGVRLHDYGCPLKAYRAEIVKRIHLYGDLYRLIPAIASWQGVAIAEVPVRGHPVKAARLSPRAFAGLLLDVLTVRFLLSYAMRPMHSFGLVGSALLLLTGLLGGYLSVVKFGMGQDIGGRPLLLLMVLLGVIGVQFLALGLLAELIVRVYHESQGKPIYVVRDGTIEDAPAALMPQEPTAVSSGRQG